MATLKDSPSVYVRISAFFSWEVLTFLRVCDSVRAKITRPQHIYPQVIPQVLQHYSTYNHPFFNNIVENDTLRIYVF
jgi:hypothetical protein